MFSKERLYDDKLFATLPKDELKEIYKECERMDKMGFEFYSKYSNWGYGYKNNFHMLQSHIIEELGKRDINVK